MKDKDFMKNFIKTYDTKINQQESIFPIDSLSYKIIKIQYPLSEKNKLKK